MQRKKISFLPPDLLGFLPPQPQVLVIKCPFCFTLNRIVFCFPVQREVIGFNCRSLAPFASFAVCQNPSSSAVVVVPFISNHGKRRERHSARGGEEFGKPLSLPPPLCFRPTIEFPRKWNQGPSLPWTFDKRRYHRPPLVLARKKRRDSLSATCSGLES